MKETQSHLIVMQHRLGELMPEYQVTIINLINRSIQSNRKNITKVRIHESGDFFNKSILKPG